MSTDPQPLHPDTLAIRSGRVGDATSLAPVLWATSTFASPTVDEARRMATSVGADRFYTRYGNPTVAGFEDAIAQLEGAEAARAFASGMGAVSAVVLGGWLTGRGRHAPAAVSLALSAVWAIAAVLLLPTQDFLADKLLVSGVPLVVAVVTAVVALRERH